jgi:hypothetical protein
MHGPINVKSPNNTSKWQMEFNSAFKVLNTLMFVHEMFVCITKRVCSGVDWSVRCGVVVLYV